MVKEFEFFVTKGDVKKQSSDKNLSKSTFKDSLERIEFTKGIIQHAKPKFILENAYEAAREAADSLLYLEGFKSYSHEASIVYLAKKGFNNRDLQEFDRYRKIRNGIKYYAEDCDRITSQEALDFAERVIARIRGLLELAER